MSRNSSPRPAISRKAAPAAAHPCQSPNELKVTIGTTLRSGPTSGGEMRVWAPAFATNPHVLVVGGSGAGKTHRLRVLCNSIMQCQEAELLVLDVHGDIKIENECRIRFNEQSPFGLNPLAVDPDPEAGGVRVQIENFLDGLEASSRSFGDKQRSLCRGVLERYYESIGFNRFDPATWELGPDDEQPSLAGFLEYARADMRREQLKLNEPAYEALNELKKSMRVFKGILQAKTKTDIDKAALKAKDAFNKHIIDIVEGRADHLILESYNPDVYQSVVDRIASLEATGLFKSVEPPFGDERVKVYDISKVRDREQRMFGETLFEQQLRRMKVHGERPYPYTFIVIDEASRYFNDEKDAPLSRIMREIRKFGASVILASQSVRDFPVDVISNCATTIVLGLHPQESKITANKLQIDVKLLNDIRQRTTALAQLSIVGGEGSDFVAIALPYAGTQVMAAAGIEEAHEADLAPRREAAE